MIRIENCFISRYSTCSVCHAGMYLVNILIHSLSEKLCYYNVKITSAVVCLLLLLHKYILVLFKCSSFRILLGVFLYMCTWRAVSTWKLHFMSNFVAVVATSGSRFSYFRVAVCRKSFSKTLATWRLRKTKTQTNFVKI